jgi:ABC-type ATPase involved in cell division
MEDLMTDQSAPGGIIRLNTVTKACQADVPPALADVSVDVAAGEVVALLGRAQIGDPAVSGRRLAAREPVLRRGQRNDS